MFENVNNEPLKVKNWNNPEKEETRIDYNLSIIENKQWGMIGTEIDQSGNVRTVFKDICSMP